MNPPDLQVPDLQAPDTPTRDALQARLTTILPDTYQHAGEDVQPVSMGSAGLKFSPDGTVAWNRMWASFCHLALAGGPPHRGSLLEPASPAEISAHPGRHRQVVEELCRGISLVTGLEAAPSSTPGWVRVECASPAMAGWLTRAIAIENVSVRCEGAILLLPAGPGYRLEKEIRNVITAIAKTCHYWLDHTQPARRQAIADLFAAMDRESLLVQPALPGLGFHREAHHSVATTMGESIHRLTGLQTSSHRYPGWLGVECGTIPAAIWIMRRLVASNILSRREDTTVFLPVNPATDPHAETVLPIFARIHRLALATCLVPPAQTAPVP